MKTYFKGLPTKMDVDRIEQATDPLEIGREITHEEIESLLGLDRGSSRYRTVIASWRKKQLNENNIEIGSVSGVGYRVLAPQERISESVRGFRHGLRKQMRSVRRATLVRTDDEGLRRKQDLLARAGAAIAAQATTMMLEIEPPRTEALPRPRQTED